MENLTEKDLIKLNSNKGLISLLNSDIVNTEKSVRYIDYIKKLKRLQVELIRMQSCIIDNNQRVIVIFEGRDAAGKGGAIRRLTERINPRYFRIVALPRPTEEEQTQWYFQRYIKVFPKAGEILFFDRSWYNRAVVEPVNDFCTDKEYDIFMTQVNDFERMITESGIQLVKIYMSISKREQSKRFLDIKNNPLKIWKMSRVDERAQELWDSYTDYKDKMFENTKKGGISFKVIKANRKTEARIEAIEHILQAIPYDKNKVI
jgi:polyphosphate kinase 2